MSVETKFSHSCKLIPTLGPGKECVLHSYVATELMKEGVKIRHYLSTRGLANKYLALWTIRALFQQLDFAFVAVTSA